MLVERGALLTKRPILKWFELHAQCITNNMSSADIIVFFWHISISMISKPLQLITSNFISIFLTFVYMFWAGEGRIGHELFVWSGDSNQTNSELCSQNLLAKCQKLFTDFLHPVWLTLSFIQAKTKSGCVKLMGTMRQTLQRIGSCSWTQLSTTLFKLLLFLRSALNLVLFFFHLRYGEICEQYEAKCEDSGVMIIWQAIVANVFVTWLITFTIISFFYNFT